MATLIRKMSSISKNKKNLNALMQAFSIACIVLAGISLIVSICSLVYLLIAFGTVNNTDIAQNLVSNQELGYETHLQDDILYIGNTSIGTVDLANSGLSFILIFTIIIILCASFSLFTSIYTLCSSLKNKHDKTLFNLNLVNFICSVVGISFIRTILSIVICMLIKKIQKMPYVPTIDEVIFKAKHVKK